MDAKKFYINGEWVNPSHNGQNISIVNPATEASVGEVSMGSVEDANRAVNAARHAFADYSQMPLSERVALLRNLVAVFERRYEEMVTAICTEMGAPYTLASESQAACGPGHINETIEAALALDWNARKGDTANLVREPIGVCVLITPWNWPVNQLTSKVAPALAAGCTVVLKPSEMAPLSAQLFTEFVDEAGFPAGVFNMLHGTGQTVGSVLTSHPEVDMVSFTGSTAAGVAVAKSAADTVKRVAQELGSKSPNIILADADLEGAVERGVRHCFNNSGQSCNAPTRMLVEESVYEQVVQMAAAVAETIHVGDPATAGEHIGPVVNQQQFDKVQHYIKVGIDEGARLVIGGLGKPEGFEQGYYVKPTIFADVNNAMVIAQEEIFGPVLCIIPFKTHDEVVQIANDSPFGLAAYIQGGDLETTQRLAGRIKAGSVHINGAYQDYCSPFGGYKQSGNGREWGEYGLHDYLEYKSINGFYAA